MEHLMNWPSIDQDKHTKKTIFKSSIQKQVILTMCVVTRAETSNKLLPDTEWKRLKWFMIRRPPEL